MRNVAGLSISTVKHVAVGLVKYKTAPQATMTAHDMGGIKGPEVEDHKTALFVERYDKIFELIYQQSVAKNYQ